VVRVGRREGTVIATTFYEGMGDWPKVTLRSTLATRRTCAALGRLDEIFPGQGDPAPETNAW